MPNWVTNEVTFTFDMSHQKRKFLDLVKSDDNPFDFDKIIPMPKIFNDICQSKSGGNGLKWHYQDSTKPNGVGERLTELEVSRLKKEHGTLGSYDWCCENWGTKWNSVHHVETGNDDYDDELYVWFGFNTAWSAPTPIAHFLKHKFEGIKFRWFYRDESDMFCGYLDDDIGGF
jgi:hypothetical protein